MSHNFRLHTGTTIKRHALWIVLLCLFQISLAPSAFSQNRVVFSQYFYQGQYAANQCTAWTAFRQSLQPGAYTSMTIRGTYDLTGLTCTDATVVNAMADAIKNLYTYISPTVQGHVWHFCTLHTWYNEGGIWIDPPSSCNGADCPSPAYLIRPCIGPYNDNWGGVNTATCYGPDQLMEVIFEGPSSPNDAAIESIDSPLNFCAGTYPIIVTLKNNATMPITNVTINWQLNGANQTPVAWTGLLDTLTQNTRRTSVTLMSAYNFVSGVPYTFKAWTSNPNGVADTVTYNDTVTVTRKCAMSGDKTIGGAAPDYANFTAAVADLVHNGLCGPVVFKVRGGTYNERIVIDEIPGASAFNTVTFESESGIPASVNLTYNSMSYDDNGVLNFDGCDFVTFQNMTITPQSASYGQAVTIKGGSNYCTLNNLTLAGVTTYNTWEDQAVVYSPYGSNDNNNTITNCRITNGSMGIYWSGPSWNSYETGNVIEKNTVDGFYGNGLYILNQDAPVVNQNTIKSNNGNWWVYGMYLEYCMNQMRITNNTITYLGSGTKQGIYGYGCQGGGTGTEGIIANNFITISNGTADAYGIYLYDFYYQLIYYNTIYLNSTSQWGAGAYLGYCYNLNMRNNIFYSDGSAYCLYQYYCSFDDLDYNLYKTSGPYIASWDWTDLTDLAALRNYNGMDNSSITKTVDFLDEANGDLHLTGNSEDDADLTGILVPEVTNDIDDDTRVIPYRGADEACYITRGSVYFEFVDGNGVKTPYANIPGSGKVHYHVAFPDYDATITVTLNFYTIPGNMLAYSTSFTVQKQLGQVLDGIATVSFGNLTQGQYRVDAVFYTKNSCNSYRNYSPPNQAMMLLPQGVLPCLVWPGDANNDGIVNYGDRKALNTYIHDANMSATWLNGPARYRADVATNPLTYYTWEAQAAVPWATPEGCYMDCDGNGVVNNWDFLVIKVNWMRSHGPSPKAIHSSDLVSFDMNQNFPNPFNPSTQIQFSVPEPSNVSIIVYDVNGKEVATLAAGTVAAGVHTVAFNAEGLSSTSYIATATMRGLETGTEFTKTIRMTLSK